MVRPGYGYRVSPVPWFSQSRDRGRDGSLAIDVGPDLRECSPVAAVGHRSRQLIPSRRGPTIALPI
jgi:hypothetical protein